MNLIQRIAPILIFLFCVSSSSIFGQKTYTHDGTTTTKAIGKEEILHHQMLKVIENGATLKVNLEGYEAFGHKGIGISGTIVRDANNRIIEYKDLKVTGISGVKIQSITGTISSKKADIILVGKLAGIFNFRISYRGEHP